MEKEIKQLKKVESSINRHLYIICAVITFLTMAMIVIEFFSKGEFMPARMELFYLGVLLIYSLHKEMIRWLGKRTVDRQGEYFVYAWIFLTATLYFINFLTNRFFTCFPDGGESNVLTNLSVLTVEVLAIFIFTRCLKILKAYLKKTKGL